MSMKEKLKKLLGGRSFAVRKSVVFVLAAGLLLGAGGVLFFQWYNPKDEPQTSAINML